MENIVWFVMEVGLVFIDIEDLFSKVNFFLKEVEVELIINVVFSDD